MTSNNLKVVISQPMYFPWIGMFQQLHLADAFVFLDDVQLARGFYNRVQIKTDSGSKWLSVPVKRLSRSQLIMSSEIDYTKNWKENHEQLLAHNLKQSPYYSDAIEVFREVAKANHQSLAELTIASMRAVARYWGMDNNVEYYKASDLACSKGSGSEKILNICKGVGASTYITGHGAKNYLEHEKFDDKGITVEYMNYNTTPYSQNFGLFTPYVTSLDTIANLGSSVGTHLHSKTTNWLDFINE
ncbi:WbqC family protein [Pseudoalteromonas sp. McH1-7]|uniref:WbqC family protein n=1 Tax=unclassified Pseudoalteromonas TaxID=194690 RepID=UPI000FFE42AC|nr:MULTISPECIES: WbqC family protein [unclassified Pseudoalteromonas]NUZ09594.1 WbqC family protein [Pseudoalteromonas sp. McH1-7]RXF07180.1 hypothetical protein D9603_00385 [Pseudoalteromonas sp. PS5]USD29616.1 WbqC family protein [Pseudoalteromonas sp. SCSIO 43201]